ncbi:MAG: SH3 domain-containing protein [Phascolarctobacterium sp.]|nr:SH3 domain-containing protein [Phascolarctobacterium sp.]
MKKALLLAAALTTLCSSCFAENWVKVCNVIEYEYHMDVDSVVAAGPYMYTYKYKLVDSKDDFDRIMPYDQGVSYFPHKENVGEIAHASFKGVYKQCTKKEVQDFLPGGTDVNIRVEPNTNCEVLGTMNPSEKKVDCEYFLLASGEGDGSWSRVTIFDAKDDYWEMTTGYVKSQYVKVK